MTDDIKKLAADLVKSPHWRWIPGMRAIGQIPGLPEPSRVVADGEDVITTGGHGAPLGGGSPCSEWLARAIPDLDDPLTAAGLLLVAREAWADPNLYCCNLDGYDGCGWTTIIDRSDHPNSRHGVLWICGLTETEALARAILAAPTVTNKETP